MEGNVDKKKLGGLQILGSTFMIASSVLALNDSWAWAVATGCIGAALILYAGINVLRIAIRGKP